MFAWWAGRDEDGRKLFFRVAPFLLCLPWSSSRFCWGYNSQFSTSTMEAGRGRFPVCVLSGVYVRVH